VLPDYASCMLHIPGVFLICLSAFLIPHQLLKETEGTVLEYIQYQVPIRNLNNFLSFTEQQFQVS
jgi:hypothetical protein